MISSWLLRAVSEQIEQSVLYIDLAKDIWDDLANRFSRSDTHRISCLHDEINNSRQDSMTVMEYYTKCKGLWDELNAPRCECGLVSKIKREKEDDNVIRFLKGLSEEFETIKSRVLVLDPMPPVHRVFTMALKLEKKIKVNGNYYNDLAHANASIIDSRNQ